MILSSTLTTVFADELMATLVDMVGGAVKRGFDCEEEEAIIVVDALLLAFPLTRGRPPAWSFATQLSTSASDFLAVFLKVK